MSYTSILRKSAASRSGHGSGHPASRGQVQPRGMAKTPSVDSMTNSINHMMNNSYTYNYNPKYRVTRLPNPPSFLEYGSLKFVIMDAPTDDNLRTYIKVSAHCRLVCACAIMRFCVFGTECRS